MRQRRIVRWTIVGLVLAFVVGLPGYLILRKKQMADALEIWLPSRGFTPAPCPPGIFGHGDMSDERCFRGQADGRPVDLLLGRRWMPETANRPRGSGIAQDSFIGVAVDRAPEAWLEGWRARLGYGGADPVRVEHGVIVFRGLWDPEVIEARLEEVTGSLR
jgi:hypothetical protein